MTLKAAPPLGIEVGPDYRTVAEVDVVALLVRFGWACEVALGESATAEREAAASLDRLVLAGLPVAMAEDGSRRFDPAEVVNFFKLSGLNGTDPFWEDRCVTTGRRVVQEFRAPGDLADGPPALDLLGPRRFAVTLRRDFDLGHVRTGSRVRLRLPLPLEDAALSALTVAVTAPTNLGAEFTVAVGRLDATFAMPAVPEVSIAADIAFTAFPTVPESSSAPLDAASVDLYTRPREGILCVSPRIQNLAADLAGAARDPSVVVASFWDFIIDRLRIGVVHYDQLPEAAPTDWVLDAGWCDCQLGSALLAALCRAQAIPARLVSGYTLYAANPSYHYWTEVWLEGRGWTPFDLSAWDFSAGGRDAFWRDCYFGRLDYRMKTQSMPRVFTGTPSVRFPERWHLLSRLAENGGVISYVAVDSGALIFRDRIVILPA